MPWVDHTELPPRDWKPNTKLLYATATSLGWKHQQVKDLIHNKWGRSSTKDLSFAQFNRLLDLFAEISPDNIPPPRDKETVEMFE